MYNRVPFLVVGGASNSGKGKDESAKGENGGRDPKDPKTLLVDILRNKPNHEALQLPCMKLPALRSEIRKRLGFKWDKV